MNRGYAATIAASLAVTVFAVHTVISLLAGNLASTSQWAIIASTALASAALITIATKVIAAAIGRSMPLLKLVLGGCFLRGTWVGRIRTAGGRVLHFVEYYEQDTLGLVIRGSSFSPDSSVADASWFTKCVEVDPREGRLLCLYETHIPSPTRDREEVRYGTGRFDFVERESPDGPATRMRGSAVDEFRGKRLDYEEMLKISSKLLPLEVARRQLVDEFEARGLGA